MLSATASVAVEEPSNWQGSPGFWVMHTDHAVDLGVLRLPGRDLPFLNGEMRKSARGRIPLACQGSLCCF